MNRFRALLDHLDDRINPMVVKELRQAVRGRFVPLMLCLFLVVLTLIMSLFFSEDWTNSRESGSNLMFAFLSIYLFAAVILIPLSVAIRLASERSEENMDLLYISTLAPRRIISGKLLAGMTVMGLFLFASSPFMTLTSILGGTDIPTIFLLLTIATSVGIASLQSAILVACFAVKRVFKVMLGIFALGGLFFVYSSTLVFLIQMNDRGIGERMVSGRLWPEIFAWTLVFSFVYAGLFLISVAMIKPKPMNRAKPVRLFFTIAWLLSFAIVELWARDKERIYIWTVLVFVFCVVAMITAGSEREGVSHLMRRSIPGTSMKRMAAFLFFSGSANGIAWTSLVLGCSLAACSLHYALDLEPEFWVIVGLALHLFAYVNTSVFIRNKWLAGRLRKAYTWLVTLGLLALLTVGPWVLTMIFFPKDWANMAKMRPFHIFNPVMAGSRISSMTDFIGVALVWCLVIAILQARWFFAQYKNFRPKPAAATPGATG